MKRFFLLMLFLSLLQMKPCGMENSARGAELPMSIPRTAPLVLPAINKYTILNHLDRSIRQEDMTVFCAKSGSGLMVNGTKQLLRSG